MIPGPKRGGNKRTVKLREVVNGLMCIPGTGCQWRALPKDLAPRSAVRECFARWDWDGTLAPPRGPLPAMPGASGTGRQPDRRHCRTKGVAGHRQPKREGRRKRGRHIDPPGWDGGKTRRVLVAAQGLLMHAIVHAAGIQASRGATVRDRDGGVLLRAALCGACPFLLKLHADSGYQGPQFQAGLRQVTRQVEVEIVKRSDDKKGFAALPRRWPVERTIAWLNRCRRLAEDWECLNRRARAFPHLASIRLMVRKPCQTKT